MNATTSESLLERKCKPCEGGIPKLSPSEASALLKQVSGWQLVDDSTRIRREWRMKDFLAALDFFQKVGQLAEDEQHHPDLHLTSYRNVRIDINTHAIGGLSENDFILAAKIDQISVRLKNG
jgi:4a-hydroxytetrahydrobiopterin dehydratase